MNYFIISYIIIAILLSSVHGIITGLINQNCYNNIIKELKNQFIDPSLFLQSPLFYQQKKTALWKGFWLGTITFLIVFTLFGIYILLK